MNGQQVVHTQLPNKLCIEAPIGRGRDPGHYRELANGSFRAKERNANGTEKRVVDYEVTGACCHTLDRQSHVYYLEKRGHGNNATYVKHDDQKITEISEAQWKDELQNRGALFYLSAK